MRLSRIISAFVIGLAVACAPAAAGAAQPVPPEYPPQPPSLTLSEATVTVGEEVTIYGSGFGSGEFVTIRITVANLAVSQLGGEVARIGDGSTVAMVPVSQVLTNRSPHRIRVRAEADGSWEVEYTPRRPGIHTFTATGETTGRTATATLTVLPRVGKDWDKDHGGKLPVTGSPVNEQVALGGGLLAGGALLVGLTWAWRRRSRSDQAAL